MLSAEEAYNQFIQDFSNCFYNMKSEIPYSDYIFLCVGSDKITGDAFGPLVGEELKRHLKNRYNNIKVIGTLEHPVSALNLQKEMENLWASCVNPCIIAIDAALSKKEDIGKIVVRNSKMQFGKSTNKKIMEVGDISIKGIVARDFKIPNANFKELQTTSLNIVMKLAKITSDGIYQVIKYR